MSIPTFDTNHSVIEYWQHGLWYSQFNKLRITGEKGFHLIDKLELFDEKTLSSLLQQNEIVWVAPWVGKQESSHQYWIPLWIPAIIQQGKLCLTDKAVPWLAPAHCDALFGQSPFVEQIHCFDDWLRFEWLTSENTLALASWQEVFEASEALFNELSDNQWHQRIESMKIALLTQHIAISAGHESASESRTSLLQAYAEIAETCPKAQFDLAQLFDSARTLSGQFSQDASLSASEYEAASHIMALNEGELIAIKSPLGTRSEKVVSTLIASHYVQSALTDKALPSTYLFTPSEALKKWTVFASSNDEIEDLHDHYETYLEGIERAKAFYSLQQKEEEQFGEIGELESQIEALQQQDEALEEQFVSLEKAQSEWQKKVKKGFWSWLFSRKKLTEDDSKALMQLLEQEISNPKEIRALFIEKARQIKVQRTKLHQALVELVEFSALQKGALTRWLEWLDKYVSSDLAGETLINQLCATQAIFGRKLFRVATYKNGWVQTALDIPQPFKEGWVLTKFNWDRLDWEAVENLEEIAGLFIIDQANRLLPQQVAPLLARAQRAVFFGDNQDLSTTPVMSAVTEEWALKAYGLEEEETIEQLQYKGMLLGTGNAFSVALANSSYQQLLDHGMYSSVLSLDGQMKPDLKYHSVLVEGESEPSENMRINQKEAAAIAAWLSKDLPLLDETAIVTPFQSQKEAILHELQLCNISCEVLTFYELKEKQWQNIIFSPVYTHKDKRPFVFDQGDHLLYSLIIRAIENLWVIGDLTIFDLKTHSPSGHLAKLLFAKKHELTEIS